MPLGIELIKAFAASFLLGLFFVPLVRRFAEKNHIVDLPSLRKVHDRPIPRLGGLAVYLGFLIVCLALIPFDGRFKGFFLGATVMVIIGILDDILDLEARTKLAGQIIGGLIAIYFGIQVTYVTNFFESAGVAALGWLGVPLTLLWIVAMTNTMNIIDGLDGLCSGIGTIASLTLVAVLFFQSGGEFPSQGYSVSIALMALAGSCSAFLCFNFYPATIFLGDSGSLLIGYSLSVLSILGSLKGATLVTLVTPILALGLPIFDTLFAILRRRWMGRPIFQGDREHIHHQLMKVGLGQKGVVLVLYAVSTLFGISAVLVSRFSPRAALGFLFVLTTVTFLAMMIFLLNFKERGNHDIE